MTAMLEQVVQYAGLLGDPEPEEEALLEALCAAAIQELTGRLKEGWTAEDCGTAFPVAAAWLALAGLRTGREENGIPVSWTAGAVSVKGTEGAGQPAETLRAQAERLMAPFLRDETFYFRGVRG